jgi:phosphatidylglycerophosphate synthase
MAIAEAGAALAAWRLGLSPSFIVESGGIFLVTMAVAAGRVQAHHPFRGFGGANLTTTIRLALVAVVAAMLGQPYSPALAWAAAALTVVVTALDGVDGAIARRSSLASAFGARFDMETDAWLLLVLSALAWRWDRAGAWVLACGLMRYVFVAAGWVWRWLDAPLPPSQRRKTVCVVQIVTLGVIVAPMIPRLVSVLAAAVTLGLLTWSFGVDVVWLARQHAAGPR